eukprot:TRINITY_DN1486_c0_g3_i1.p3 TRINITY_DN1486_c0_g3~~TRINITY_DN1486_c0_g3_i1.p3  ORF type:complete len:154 (-),score=17.75 TRINITY_DN1486_c0_g3_i1:585-1046(-)
MSSACTDAVTTSARYVLASLSRLRGVVVGAVPAACSFVALDGALCCLDIVVQYCLLQVGAPPPREPHTLRSALPWWQLHIPVLRNVARPVLRDNVESGSNFLVHIGVEVITLAQRLKQQLLVGSTPQPTLRDCSASSPNWPGIHILMGTPNSS